MLYMLQDMMNVPEGLIFVMLMQKMVLQLYIVEYMQWYIL